MGDLKDRLGNKSDGQLIRAGHWNDLVDALDDLLETIDGRIQDATTEAVKELENRLSVPLGALRNDLDDIMDRMDFIEPQVHSLQERVHALTHSFLRLNLRTTRQHYSLGQQAEIEIELLGFDGKPHAFEAEARPWVTLLTSWGQFVTTGSFDTRGGVGDRSLVIRVDEKGRARVRLRADNIEGLSGDEEQEVRDILDIRLTGQKSIGETLLAASTAADAPLIEAFTKLTESYDTAPGFRKFVDIYYPNPPFRTGPVTQPRAPQRFRDFNATLVALVTDDNDPTTADFSRGSAPLMVTFRDWIGPFIDLRFLPDISDRAAELAARLGRRIDRNDNFDAAVLKLKDLTRELLADKGVVGRIRQYRALREAFLQLDVADPPPHLDKLRDALGNAVAIGESMEVAQVRSGERGDNAALDVFTNQALSIDRAGKDLGRDVNDKVDGFKKDLDALTEATKGVQTQTEDVSQRLEAANTLFGELNRLDVGRIVDQTNRFQVLEETVNRLRVGG